MSPTRPDRGKETMAFARPEGAWISRGVLYFATSADDHVWALNLQTSILSVVYDGTGPLHNADNVTVHEPTGHLYVAEDGDDLQLVLLYPEGPGWAAAPFLQLVGHRSRRSAARRSARTRRGCASTHNGG